MKILGIETSCDETAAAVVENGTKILSNVVSSSSKIQAEKGGVIPEIAAREHTKLIVPVIVRAIVEAADESGDRINLSQATKWAKKNIDAIAVTAGPGLIGCLLVGVEMAKTLSFVWGKPIVPTVHTLSHLYANWLNSKSEPKLPAVVLTVSGGHTDLLLMSSHEDFKILGSTRDDTAGEAYDKIARFLGLPFPGGPEIEKSAKKGNPNKFNLPRPLANTDSYEFSFSGLKTAVIRQAEMTPFAKPDMAASAQKAINEVLVLKTNKAVGEFKVDSILLAGGVAANKDLREKLKTTSKAQVSIPNIDLCTDNGAFVASCAFFNYKPLPWSEITAESDTSYSLRKYANYKN